MVLSKEMKKYHYIYKITFNTGQFYIGSRTTNKPPEKDTGYWGSPVTYKHLWEDVNLTKEKIILHVCESVEEKIELERKLIKEAWVQYPNLCLNMHFSTGFHPEICKKNGLEHKRNRTGIFSLSKEQKIEIGKRNYELKIGIHGLTEEEKRTISSKAGQIAYEKKLGVFSLNKEQLAENGKKGAEKLKKLRIGIHGLTKEERRKISIKAGNIVKERGVGFFSLSKDELSNAGKKGGGKTAEKTSKEFKLKSPEGKIYVGKNIRKFCRDNNLCRVCIGGVIVGKYKQHKGWTLP
jgi:general stress protein YciG